MRKIAFILAFAFLVSLTGCGEVSVSGNHAVGPDGVSIEILSAERTAEEGTVLEVRWKNESDRDILFGSDFGVDRLKEDSWVKVKARPNTAFTMEAYLLRAHTSLERTYRLDWAYDVSKAGSYRLTVNYSFYDDESNTHDDLWAEFAAGEEPESAVQDNQNRGNFTRISDWKTFLDQNLENAEGYDKDFFRDHDLLLIDLGEGSSSDAYRVKKTEYADGILSVWVNQSPSTVSTTDLVFLYVTVPVEKNLEIKDVQVKHGDFQQQEAAFQSPPKLEILYDGGTFEAQKGTYSWHYDTGDGTWAAVMADGLHPLQMKKHLDLVSCGSNQIRLAFEEAPDSFTVRCWPKRDFGNTDAVSEVPQIWNNTVKLNGGGWIYEVTATWNKESYNGTATYIFYMAPAVLQNGLY